MKFKVGDKIVLIEKNGAQWRSGHTSWHIGDKFLITKIKDSGAILLEALQEREGKTTSTSGYNPDCFKLDRIDDWQAEMEETR